MKLRLKGNSIRLRLTRSEVDQLAAEGRVEELVELGNDSSRFVYVVRTSSNGLPVTADFDGVELCVVVPETAAREWAGSDTVTIENDEHAAVRILVEKDFACLSSRPGEDESDMFANPASVTC